MGTWNSNSWSSRENENSNFRSTLVQNLDLDILCLNETFLVDNQCLKVANYKWFGHNRKSIHRRARRGAGGVGVLVNNRVFDYFDVSVLDDTKEDIFWLKVSSKQDDFVMCLCTCYLPPKSSSHKVDGDSFFNSLLD